MTAVTRSPPRLADTGLMSGYEKSKSYGGPPVTWQGLALAIVAVVLISVALVLKS